jgi:hypothetical protein
MPLASSTSSGAVAGTWNVVVAVVVVVVVVLLHKHTV